MQRLLFVCVHNAGRSVMAEAFANQMGRGRVEALSAGTLPSERPHPEVVEAMAELGLDVSRHRGRVLTDALLDWADLVITMGCAVDEDACPAIVSKAVEDWALPDPGGQSPDSVREIRDEIRRRVSLTVRLPYSA